MCIRDRPNILAGEMIVPELLQNDVTGKALADALWFQLTDEENRRKLQERFDAMHYSLDVYKRQGFRERLRGWG